MRESELIILLLIPLPCGTVADTSYRIMAVVEREHRIRRRMAIRRHSEGCRKDKTAPDCQDSFTPQANAHQRAAGIGPISNQETAPHHDRLTAHNHYTPLQLPCPLLCKTR